MCWMGLMGQAWGQKTLIKEAAATPQGDSAKAVGQGKAALRGALLMEASRDSLRGQDLTPPSDVVDTFGLQETVVHQRSFLRREALVAAHDRLISLHAQLSEAEAQLSKSEQDKRFSKADVDLATANLAARKEILADLETSFLRLQKDWEAATGMKLESNKDAALPAKDAKTPK